MCKGAAKQIKTMEEKIESGIFAVEGNDKIALLIRCGGKIAPIVNCNPATSLTAVDIAELAECQEIGKSMLTSDLRAELTKPVIRIEATNPNSWKVFLDSFVKVYVAQKAMCENPNIEKDKLLEIINGDYTVSIARNLHQS